MNKTWQFRAFAVYLTLGLPLSASCAKEANTLEDIDDTGGGKSSTAGSSSKAGGTSKAGSTSAFGGTGGKMGGTAGTTTTPDGGEPASAGGEGTGGSAGSSGGGSAGSGGGGGSGGMVGVPPDVLENASVVLHYQTDKTTASTSVVHMKMFMENKSDTALTMANVKVRYWVKSEAASPQLATDHQGGNISGASSTYVDDGDNSHVVMTFTGKTVPKGADLNLNEFQLRLQGGTQDQSNDFSWQPAFTARMPHDKITVYLADKLIWGCEPSGVCFDDEPTGGGGAGSGGDGAGGAGGAN